LQRRDGAIHTPEEEGSIMHRLIRRAVVASVALAGLGCGSKNQPEMPTPDTPEPSSVYTPYTPAPRTEVPKSLLDDARRATLEARIHFNFDQSDLTSAARQSLTDKAEILRAIPDLTLRIEGHADERGSDEYNLALSNGRAATARRFLVDWGISADRLETFGYGEEQPVDQGENEAAWASNRRNEFRVSTGPLAQQ
jgi:peptidoglycan-associated lipoprotein